MEYKHSALTGEIIGAALEVHKEMGCGFQEVVYQRALEAEFIFRKIDFSREHEMVVYYKYVEVGVRRVDFLVSGLIAVELKAVKKLEDIHLAQGLNYLEAYNLEIGLLINFGSHSLEVKRLFNNKYKPVIR